jgi:hypothetical protein
MTAGEAIAMVARPTFSGTMRARRVKKEHQSVTAKQWMSYIAIAAITTWATQKAYDFVDEQFGVTDV